MYRMVSAGNELLSIAIRWLRFASSIPCCSKILRIHTGVIGKDGHSGNGMVYCWSPSAQGMGGIPVGMWSGSGCWVPESQRSWKLGKVSGLEAAGIAAWW